MFILFFFDGHCDTITTAMKKNEGLFQNTCHIDFKRLFEFEYPVQVFSIWLEKKYLKDAYCSTLKAIEFFKNEIENNADFIGNVFCFNDIKENINNRKISGIIGIEGGEAFEGSIEKFERLCYEGVRVINLTWNYENELGFGAVTESKKGLKSFGKAIVKKMNEKNIIIDVSHLNEAGFWNVYDLSEKPFIASHSNSYSICPHCRNLTDEQIRVIAEKRGVIGINLYPFFLEKNGNADIEDILRHIDYIINIGGDECVGFGCDFDGIDCCINGVENINGIKIIYKKILERYGIITTCKIMGGNFMRVFENVL